MGIIYPLLELATLGRKPGLAYSVAFDRVRPTEAWSFIEASSSLFSSCIHFQREPKVHTLSFRTFARFPPRHTSIHTRIKSAHLVPSTHPPSSAPTACRPACSAVVEAALFARPLPRFRNMRPASTTSTVYGRCCGGGCDASSGIVFEEQSMFCSLRGPYTN